MGVVRHLRVVRTGSFKTYKKFLQILTYIERTDVPCCENLRAS
jgi:hypothetical protein